MNVRLVSPTPGANLLDKIAMMARVSNPNNQENNKTAERLTRYLIKHKHWSPFEMANIVLEITTTRDIARQILRHRSFSFQEFSQRYAEVGDLGFPFEYKEARMQDSTNRQNSIVLDNDSEIHYQWLQKQKKVTDAASDAYQWALDKGIAKEQARAVLPEGITISRMYMQGSVRSWIHYIDLRSSIETQKEHREVAVACANCIESVFPMIKEFVWV
jgi:thymidylate synthase (FAD)